MSPAFLSAVPNVTIEPDLAEIGPVLYSNLLPDDTICVNMILMAYKGARRIEHKKPSREPVGVQKTPDRRWLLVDDEFSRRTLKQSESLAKLSHDIRNHLYIVIGFTELMLEEIPGKINDEQRHNLSDVLNSGKCLLTLTDDIVIQSGVK
jgi:signal transduction histidine kinase